MISKRRLDNALSSQKLREGPDDGPSRARRAEKVSILARRVTVVINQVVIDLDFSHHDPPNATPEIFTPFSIKDVVFQVSLSAEQTEC